MMARRNRHRTLLLGIALMLGGQALRAQDFGLQGNIEPAFAVMTIHITVKKCAADFPALSSGLASAYQGLKVRNAPSIPVDWWPTDDSMSPDYINNTLYKNHRQPTEQDCSGVLQALKGPDIDKQLQALFAAARAKGNKPTTTNRP